MVGVAATVGSVLRGWTIGTGVLPGYVTEAGKVLLVVVKLCLELLNLRYG
jgi:hypothetical protein